MRDDPTSDLYATAVLPEGADGDLLPGMPIGEEFAHVELPGWQVLSVLGKGGMGVVFLARQERLDRLVAVKMLPAGSAPAEKSAERLQREALTLASLNHPNIVTCLDVISGSSGTFMVMEYVPGQLSVRDLLLRFGTIPERIVVRIALDVAKGLAYAHDKAVTHHDIKPDNLLIHREDNAPPKSPESLFDEPHVRIMICDFGIARWKADSHAADGDPDMQRILGSPAYMAPEQAFAPEQADFRADIYALGATLYHLLTGERPFTGETPLATVRLKAAADLPEPAADIPLSDECRHILRRMGAMDPQQRYQSYSDLLADLEELHAHWERRPARRIGSRYPVSFWRGLVVGGIVAVLVVAITGATWVRKLFAPVPISRSASLGYWSGERSVWRVLAPDAETNAPVLTGLSARAPLLLNQPLTPGTSVHVDIRLPSRGTTVLALYENGNTRWEMRWSRDAVLHSRLQVVADGREIPIGDIAERKPLQWLAVDLQLRQKQLELQVDGRLVAVAPFRAPLDACRLGVHLLGGRMAQIKDVRIHGANR